jgi:hypothetical protein
MRLSWLRDYAALPAARDHAVVEFVGKRHDAAQVIGYNKVAFIFHMLRRDIGDAAFGRAQRDIWRSHRFRAASWSDLRRTFAAAAGRDLSRFFAQWLERTGAPRLRLEGAKAVRFGDGHTVTLDLAQDFPAFSLTLPVTILTDQGAEHFTVRMDTPQSRHTMSTRGRPTGLAIDAGFDVFRRLDPAEAPPILRDVTLDGKTMTIIAGDDAGVRKAARRLAERLLDTAPRYGDSAAAASSGAPLLVIGRRAAVAAFLGRAGLDGAPPRIASRGKARAWAARHANRRYLVVEIDDMAAFPAVIRALPHFGSRGYVVMDKDGAIDRGAWPASGGPLQVDFRP